MKLEHINQLCDVVRETSFAIHRSVRTNVDEPVAQLLGYLRSSRIEIGPLLNFGAQILSVKKHLMSGQTL